MKITILGIGTRGDVQPYIALSKGLIDAGFEVCMVAAENFEDWVRSEGLDFVPIDLDMHALMNDSSGQEWVESGGNPFNEMRNMKATLEKFDDSFVGLIEPIQSADAVISGFTSFFYADSVLEQNPKPHVVALLQPLLPTTSGDATLQPFFSGRDNWLNRISGNIGLWVMSWVGKNSLNKFRDHLGLSPLGYRELMGRWKKATMLHGFSPAVVPQPVDLPAERVYVSGYWFTDEADMEWDAPADLQAFLDSGDPPIYVGFGSMSNRDPQGVTQLILDATQQSGQRVILLSGWAGLNAESTPDNVFVLESAPHTWLFPRMAGVIHHGGAGTTAAGLRAGVPTTVIPHFADQPYWGRRVHELGVGTKPIPRWELTVDKLAEAMTQLATDKTIQAQASQLGEQIREEDGIGNAVQFIQKQFGV